jgi:hypothetical protein
VSTHPDLILNIGNIDRMALVSVLFLIFLPDNLAGLRIMYTFANSERIEGMADRASLCLMN